MKQIIRSKISRKFLTLAFLIFSLVFLASSDFSTRAVEASECTDACVADLGWCHEDCNDPNTTYTGCHAACIRGYNNCVAECGE
ncbi:MAG TPA: hypothetical protein VK400_06765 [Pyrinomonadaceae bacterium]|nr:hypothetical protein [Pyrinomonadaceae bacterium]